MDIAEQIGWGALDTLGIKASARSEVIAAGGPSAFLAAQPSDTPRVTVKHRVALERFVDGGGTVLGGSQPERLGALLDAPRRPLVAYARGRCGLLTRPRRVAIVGTRMPTNEGLKAATRFAEAVAALDAVVVSGAAQGIDEAAHRGALNVSGATVAVLGQPLGAGDERPARLRDVFARSAQALTLTLFGPHLAAQRWCWASRNQYIAALADVVIVVEGGAKSGTLHTATYARRLGRPVLAVPGRPSDPQAGAANLLLRKGHALALTDEDDIRIALGLKKTARPPRPPARKQARGRPGAPGASNAMDGDAELPPLVERLVRTGPCSLDALARTERRDVAALLAELMLLEMEGLVEVQGGTVRVRRQATVQS